MTPNATSDDALFRRLADHTDESATLALFTVLCRTSPQLRHWLWEDFGRDAKVRAKFQRIVNTASAEEPSSFADLTTDRASRRQEKAYLRAQVLPQRYGGLTWDEITALIRHYQAGTLDLGAFLLVHDWRKAKAASPRLWWAGISLLESVVPSGRRRLLKHLDKTLAFLKRYQDPSQRRASIGHSDWWKLHALVFILRHPRESYRTRELRTHLAQLGLEVSPKEIRRFCARHGIRRDMRAGRPRGRTPRG